VSGFRVDPEQLSAAGVALQGVATRLVGELSGFQAELAGFGSPWGSDDIGSLIGAAHGEVASFAFECYQSALDEMAVAGADVTGMGDRYLQIETTNHDRFRQLDQGLGS